jgi:2-methylisocitrate lyase-like PEP mutase family enzyme
MVYPLESLLLQEQNVFTWYASSLATLNDMLSNASTISSLSPSTPVIADADTGYGGPIMVARTTRQYALAGIAALHIEDQVQEKRCGHLVGKQCVSREVYYARLRAAVKTRNEMGSEMLVIARTDARADLGFEEAVERLKGAVECGVDALFLEALQSEEECEKAVKIFAPTPVLLNMVPGGKTPQMGVKRAKEIGFKLYINPTLGLEAVVRPLEKAYKMLVEQGTDECEPIGPKALFEICGLNDAMAFDESVGGAAFGSK